VTGLLPALAGAQVDRLLLMLLALASAGVFVVIVRRRPVVLAVAYLAVLGLVPIWTGLSVRIFLQPQLLIGLLVLAVVLPQARRLGVRLTLADLLVGLFVLACVAPLAAGGASITSVVTAVQYFAAYLVGRLLPGLVGPDRLLLVTTGVFAIVALLAVGEQLTGTNVFQSFPGSAGLHAQWANIQIRGGTARAEGAFGHSIALGASLAMSIPLALAAPLRPWIRVAAVVLTMAAVVVTFSRIALITAGVGILCAIVASRELPARLRVMLAVAGTMVALAAAPLVSRVFLAAGDEATNSAAYRGDLVSLIGDIDVLGFSSAFSRAPNGAVSFEAFNSIDSALILHGLIYGWASLAVALVLLAVALVAVLLRRAAAPTMAVVAQIPALFAVALITQYATVFWFVAGFAVYAQTARTATRPETRQVDAPAGLPRTGEHASDQGGPRVSLDERTLSVRGLEG
jgi:hypothetical protein